MKHQRKLLGLLLAVILIIGLSVSAHADGPTPKFVVRDGIAVKYLDKDTTVITAEMFQQEGITAIGASCFKDSNVTSVTIPSTVTSIQSKAFSDCRKLTNVSLSGKITAIPATAGYEMETTEFDTTAAYAPNDALVAGTGDNLGKVVKATSGLGSESILGFVSLAPATDEHGNKRLAFFTAFVPAAGAADESTSN